MGGHAGNYFGLALWDVPRLIASMAFRRRRCAPDHAVAAFCRVTERFLGTPMESRLPSVDASTHFPARANPKRRFGCDSAFLFRFRSDSRSRDFTSGARRLRLSVLLFCFSGVGGSV